MCEAALGIETSLLTVWDDDEHGRFIKA